MKKILNIGTFLSTVVLILFTFSSCKDDDSTVYGQSVSERQKEWIAKCDETLLSSAAGWRFDYSTLLGSSTIFFMDFQEGGVVDMADLSVSETTYESSYYGYNVGQGVILSFVTQSPLSEHVKGARGDIEFIIESIDTDSIVLIGRKYQTRSVMRRAVTGEINRVRLQRILDKSFGQASYFNAFSGSGSSVDVNLIGYGEKLSLTTAENVFTEYDIIYTAEGFNLSSPITVGGTTTSTFKWNNSTFVSDDSSVSLVATNMTQFPIGDTADKIIGYTYDILGGSPNVETWISSVKAGSSRFSGFKRFDVYINKDVTVDSIYIEINQYRDTTIVKQTQNIIEDYISMSYVLQAGNDNWSNFKGSGYTILRKDILKLSSSLRDGDYANDINQLPAARNINNLFYTSAGVTVILKEDLIYLVSAANAKNWLILRKKDDQNARQIRYKNL